MLILDAFSHNENNNYTFIDFFPKSNKGSFLLIYSEKNDNIQKNLTKHIFSRYLTFVNKSHKNCKTDIKDFFVELNWFINSYLNKNNSSLKGLSLAFGMILNNKLLLVQFGKMLIGKISHNSINPIGIKWENFHLNSIEDIFLLGSKQTDINVPINEIILKEKEEIVIIPSDFRNINFSQKQEAVQQLKKAKIPFIWISNNAEKTKYPSFFEKYRTLIITLIVLILTFCSFFYVFKWNNPIATTLSSGQQMTREFSKNSLQSKIQSALLDLKKEFNNNNDESKIVLLERIQESLESFSELLITPAKEILFNKEESYKLKKELSTIPVFDFKNIYIAYNDALVLLDKNSMRPKKSLSIHNIQEISVLDANQLIISTKDSLYCLRRDLKKKFWQKEFKQKRKFFNLPIIKEISIDDDPRLNSNIILIVNSDSIMLFNGYDGKYLSSYKAKKSISFISSYDNIKKCFYIVDDGFLIKLELVVKN